MQPKAGGKLHLRLNTGMRPIVNKYRKKIKKLKKTLKRVQEGVKPLRGKRVGSAQSAQKIQPGGGPGRAGSPADLSCSLFLPTPRHSSLRLQGGEGRKKKRSWGDCGGRQAGPRVGSAGDRPPASNWAPPGAFPPWQYTATGSGMAKKARQER